MPSVAAAKAALTQAVAQVQQKQAAVTVAQTNLDYTTIHAPIDGTVIARSVDVGQTVAASLQAPTLFTIAQDLTKMQVYASTDESDVGMIRTGQVITFKVDAFPKDTFSGKVSQVRLNATTVQNVVTYNTIIDFDNPDLKLFPGMTAYITIPVASATNVLRVPNGALRYKPDMPADQVRALYKKYGLISGQSAGAQTASNQGSGNTGADSKQRRAQGEGTQGGGAPAEWAADAHSASRRCRSLETASRQNSRAGEDPHRHHRPHHYRSRASAQWSTQRRRRTGHRRDDARFKRRHPRPGPGWRVRRAEGKWQRSHNPRLSPVGQSGQPSLIQIEDVHKYYDLGETKVHALRGVNVRIERGEFVAIMGASGSGKSTFMNILGCLDKPTTGRYLLDGIAVSELSKKELATIRNRKIGFVFQGFNLLSRTTALENVELPTLYAQVSKEEGRKRAREALELVGLGDRMEHFPSQLSGGQQQRVAIARGLVNHPSILLADEPTGNLDSRTSVEILEVFQKLNDDGLTVVMVTHEPDIAEFAKRGIHFRDGSIRRDEAVQNRPVAAEVLKNMPALED